jgi:hypothetical protein
MEAKSLTAVARHFGFVAETDGPNDGAWVTFLQRFTNNHPGDSWCASFVSVVLDISYRGRSPLKRSANCDDLLNQAHKLGWVVPAGAPPQEDDLFFYVKPGSAETPYGDAHHIGIVTGVQSGVVGIAGNTSSDGASSNGTGVFEHGLSKANIVYVRLPKVI